MINSLTCWWQKEAAKIRSPIYCSQGKLARKKTAPPELRLPFRIVISVCEVFSHPPSSINMVFFSFPANSNSFVWTTVTAYLKSKPLLLSASQSEAVYIWKTTLVSISMNDIPMHLGRHIHYHTRAHHIILPTTDINYFFQKPQLKYIHTYM